MSTEFTPRAARTLRSESITKIAEALSNFQGELKQPKKQVENSFFKSSYADLPALVAVAQEPLKKHGLAVVQMPTTDELGHLELVTELVHKSGEYFRSYYPVRPVKSDPQGVGSAITYARRYSYQAILGIAPEGEDDDGNAASGRNGNGHHGEQNGAPRHDHGGVRAAVSDAQEREERPRTAAGVMSWKRTEPPTEPQKKLIYVLLKKAQIPKELMKPLVEKFQSALIEILQKPEDYPDDMDQIMQIVSSANSNDFEGEVS